MIKNIFHIVEALADFFASKKLVLVEYFATTTLTQRLSRSVSVFCHSFANGVASTSRVLLIARPLSHFGRQILSHTFELLKLTNQPETLQHSCKIAFTVLATFLLALQKSYNHQQTLNKELQGHSLKFSLRLDFRTVRGSLLMWREVNLLYSSDKGSGEKDTMVITNHIELQQNGNSVI